MDNKKNVILFVSSNIILDYDEELYDNVKIVNLDLPLNDLFKEIWNENTGYYPIPSMKIITDFLKFTDAAKKTIIEGSPEYESGIFEGHNRLLRTFMSMFPAISQPYRVGSSTFQMFDEK